MVYRIEEKAKNFLGYVSIRNSLLHMIPSPVNFYKNRTEQTYVTLYYNKIKKNVLRWKPNLIQNNNI